MRAKTNKSSDSLAGSCRVPGFSSGRPCRSAWIPLFPRERRCRVRARASARGVRRLAGIYGRNSESGSLPRARMRERERERTLVHARARRAWNARARARPELSTRAYPLIKFIGFAKSRARARARASALVRAWDTARCKSRPVIVPRQRYREPYGALFANKTRMGIKARRRVRVNSYRVASAVKPSNCLLKS